MQDGLGPRPFDTSLSYLIEHDAEGWLDWLGLPVDGPVTSIESDVGTVLAEVDKVLRVDAPAPWIAHIELQASRDPRLVTHLLQYHAQYHALLLHRHDVDVETTVVLLRPEADSRELTGHFEKRGKRCNRTVAFDYNVIRLWEQPVDEILTGSLGILPLAPLAAVAPRQLPDVMRRIGERFVRESDPTTADELASATNFLLSLRYDENEVRRLMLRVPELRDTWLALEIREEGRAEGRLSEARRLILRQGTLKFGTPGDEVVAVLTGLDDLTVLERLTDRILSAATWQELLEAAADC